ncbi:MAG: ATP-binding cassette domain-containing protein [Candidatus Moraniibacteriota bacterium]
MPIIQVQNLSKKYEFQKKQPGVLNSLKNLFSRKKYYKNAVKKINFNISEGELVGFLGPNGAGKTTTLKMLSGIITPTSGQAEVLGHLPWKREAVYQKQFAMVMGQKNQLWWDLPPMESFLLNKEIYEVEEKRFKENLDKLVKLLKVTDILHKQVRQLSLGERMKCELIASLLHDPKVLFLDEPTIGMDVVAQKNIRDFLLKYNQERKTTIILTSHYMEDIVKLCSRIIIIHHGGIIYDGLVDKLIKKYAPHKVVKVYLEKEITRGEAEKLGEIYEFDPTLVTYSIPRAKIRKDAARILSSPLPVRDIDIGEIKVEKIIRNIFGS